MKEFLDDNFLLQTETARKSEWSKPLSQQNISLVLRVLSSQFLNAAILPVAVLSQIGPVFPSYQAWQK